MTVLTDLLARIPALAAYGVVVAAVLAESVLLIGAFIPTLTILLTAGALANTGQLDLVVLICVTALAVMAGDALGHRTGRLLGDRLRTHRLGRRIPEAMWRQTERAMDRRGSEAVALGRFLPVIRTLTPHLAGATGLPYHRVAPYSAGAAVVWATAGAGVGYTAATSAQRLIPLAAPALAAVAGLIALVTWMRARRSRLAGARVLDTMTTEEERHLAH
ncbi:DedA family protein [Nocardia sp. XZ_19_369]|uniref:DedA family protein n=1 Tax=Nocardia sp. XZ_19_369 TaxID=2769487 RepID=UPI00188F48EC|nr:DedA family protein [Nocardia sp. XZ_19_369]